jgi:hypothetical protein
MLGENCIGRLRRDLGQERQNGAGVMHVISACGQRFHER